MLGSVVQRVNWPLGLVAALGLVFGASSAQAQNKNPGDPFSLGVLNSIDLTTTLSGTTPGSQLQVSNAATDSIALWARSSAPGGIGILGSDLYSSTGIGVLGSSGGTGVKGVGENGPGVVGETSYNIGVLGGSALGTGVVGRHNATDSSSPGVEGDTASTDSLAVGVLGKVTSTTPGSGSAAVRGINNGRASDGIGVYGSQYGSGWGVFGNSPSGRGVYGFSAGGVGVFGATSAGVAGFFDGNVTINGDLIVIAGHVKAFRIDDPLDPKHKYLVHAAVESNQVLNIYSGNITTDQDGSARVRLPGYFDRINTDLRYQLTVVGQFAQAIIAKKEADNQFMIRTDKPRVEVSWQVTARRNDAYLRAHPFHEIQNKTKANQAITGQLHGKPASQAAAP
jgi:hypothetical protein